MKWLISTLILALLLGCSTKSLITVTSFTEGVHQVSSDLLQNADFERERNKTVLFTSMVNIDNMEHSSKFGRLFSESLMTDFKINGWRVLEYRGTDIVTLSQHGEFMLNRGKLQDLNQNVLILVGTYGLVKGDLVVNTRLITSNASELISAASVTIHDRDIIDMAYEKDDINAKKLDKAYTINVLRDDCSDEEFCWRTLP
jgi:TolB-like protein